MTFPNPLNWTFRNAANKTSLMLHRTNSQHDISSSAYSLLFTFSCEPATEHIRLLFPLLLAVCFSLVVITHSQWDKEAQSLKMNQGIIKKGLRNTQNYTASAFMTSTSKMNLLSVLILTQRFLPFLYLSVFPPHLVYFQFLVNYTWCIFEYLCFLHLSFHNLLLDVTDHFNFSPERDFFPK